MARSYKPKPEQHINRLVVYLDDEYHFELLRMAALKGIPKGVLARALLQEKMDEILQGDHGKGTTTLFSIVS